MADAPFLAGRSSNCCFVGYKSRWLKVAISQEAETDACASFKLCS